MSIRSQREPGSRARRPAAMPSISSWYSRSSLGQNIRSDEARKNSQSRLVEPFRKWPRALRRSSISGARSQPCWTPISRGVPSRWTLIQPLASVRIALASSGGALTGAGAFFEQPGAERMMRIADKARSLAGGMTRQRLGTKSTSEGWRIHRRPAEHKRGPGLFGLRIVVVLAGVIAVLVDEVDAVEDDAQALELVGVELLLGLLEGRDG